MWNSLIFLKLYGYICNHTQDSQQWEKGDSTHKRKCIGKQVPNAKPIHNTYYRNREKMYLLAAEVKKSKEVSHTTFVGETMILDKVTRDTSVLGILSEG